MNCCSVIAFLGYLTITIAPEQGAKHAEVSNNHQAPASQAYETIAAAVSHETLSGDGKSQGSGKAQGSYDASDPWRHADVIQIATAVFTGLYFVATVFIFCEMKGFNRRALRLTLGSLAANKKAAEAAQKSADAAKSAADTAERALHLAERAVVLVEQVSADELIALVPETTFTIRIRNYGRTVANGVSFRIESNGAPITAVGDAAIALGAGGPYEHDFRPLFNMERGVIEDIKQGREHLSMRFEIKYADVFGTIHHTTANVYYEWVLRKMSSPHHTLCE